MLFIDDSLRVRNMSYKSKYHKNINITDQDRFMNINCISIVCQKIGETIPPKNYYQP